MYLFEEVKNDEGLSLAKELRAIYKKTSAKDAEGGVDDLFKSIGQVFLDPNSDITSNMTKEELKKRGEKIMRTKIRNKNNNSNNNNNNSDNPKNRCC